MNVGLARAMFPALLLLIFMGVPVAFPLLSVAFVLGAIAFAFSLSAVNVVAQAVDPVAAFSALPDSLPAIPAKPQSPRQMARQWQDAMRQTKSN